MRNRTSLLVLAIGLFMIAGSLNATVVVYDNLMKAQNGYASIWTPNNGAGQMFSTGGPDDSLESVVLRLRAYTAGSPTALTVGIYGTDVNSNPDKTDPKGSLNPVGYYEGGVYHDFVSYIVDSAYRDYVFIPSSGMALSGTEDYWVVALYSSGWFMWGTTSDKTFTEGVNGPGYSTLAAEIASPQFYWLHNDTADTRLMQVNLVSDEAAIPEPGAWLLTAAGGLIVLLKRRLA